MYSADYPLINIGIFEDFLEFLCLPTDNSNYMDNLLNFLSRSFGYKNLAFFLVGEQSELIYTKSINVGDESMNLYNEHYHSIDLLNPLIHHASLPTNKSILTIPDIMPLKQYEEISYYRDYIKCYNFYYILTAYFRYQGNLIGGFSLLKSKEEPNFNDHEIGALEKITPYISNRTIDWLESSRIKTENQLYRTSIEDAPYGIILLNNRYSVVSYNNMALEQSKEVLKNNESIDNAVNIFVKKYLPHYANKESEITTTLNLGRRSYNIEISPTHAFNSCMDLDTYFIVYINRIKAPNMKEPNLLLASTYGLTNREIEIVELMAKGLTNNEIGDTLIISPNTVRTHVENIRGKVGAKNRVATLQKLGKFNL